MRLLLPFTLSLFLQISAFAQNCNLTLTGQILDKSSEFTLPFSGVYVEETGGGVISDSLGFFKIENLCPGEYHLEISHVGCASEVQFLKIEKDSFIKIYMNHHSELLDEVVVHGSREDNSTQSSSTISAKDIERSGDKNLSDILENITGVSTLKNGSGISKPVVHGLFGNRVAILNNGISQAGQQWGNDHAPEIDPYAADHLSVVKGASALAYGGNSLGSVVLVEAGDFGDDPHLAGQVNYIFQSNGRGHSVNAKLEQNAKWAAWRMTGTFKKKGDSHTPDYFLTNTGNQEANASFQLEKAFNSRWKTKLYYSLFNTEIGILRGSHVGNLTDLEDAFERSEPFSTEENFSYQINAPRQKVQHHLLKFESKYFLTDSKVLNFKYGGQLNNRKEFDVRRGGRSETAALSLNQFQHFFEAVFNQNFKSDFLLKTGLQFNLIDNANLPGTGILPLIPNYLSYNPSAFLILQKEAFVRRKKTSKTQKKIESQPRAISPSRGGDRTGLGLVGEDEEDPIYETIGKLFWELGIRYDLKIFDVSAISNTVPRVIENLDHQFHNYAASTGLKYKFSKDFKVGANLGYMLRAPEINELYSSGLHQGVSGIEEGNRELFPEKSLKLVGSADWFYKKKIFVQALGYYQNINDFIYLQPQSELRLTIRGAFPVFNYEQTDATIYGTDFQLTFESLYRFKVVNKFALVRGQNRTDDLPLLFIPADNLSSTWQYNFETGKRFKNTFCSLSGKYVWRQSRLEVPEQDFLETPDGYFLLNAGVGTSVQFKHSSLDISLTAENLANVRYRDYLNRLRYFSDEVGRNLRVRVGWKFKG